jgi:hypothetical protein
MNFLISDTFTDSLVRLTGGEQKAVKTTDFDLQMDSSALEVHAMSNLGIRLQAVQLLTRRLALARTGDRTTQGDTLDGSSSTPATTGSCWRRVA